MSFFVRCRYRNSTAVMQLRRPAFNPRVSPKNQPLSNMLITCLSIFVVWFHSVTPAIANWADALPQTVQRQSKADSLLLSEIPLVVTAWTIRCFSMEKLNAPETGQCWNEAAASMTRYTQGISETLIKQVEQLQVAWLERSAQLKAELATPNSTSSNSQKVDTTDKEATIAKVRESGEAPVTTQKRIVSPKAQSKRSKAPVKKKVASVIKKTQSKTLASAAKLTQRSKRDKQALRVIKTRPLKVEPVAVQRPVEASQDQSFRTNSEAHAIRQRLRKVAEKLECSKLKCGANKRRAKRLWH